MKLNITLDLEEENIFDYYDEDCEGTLATALRDSIKTEVIQHLKGLMMKDIQESIEHVASEHIKELTAKVLEDFCNSDETFSFWDCSSKTTEGTFKDMVKMHFSRAFNNSYSQSTTERCAKQLADELKKRYDMQFAVLIVDNLKKHNLLADNRLAELIKKD